MRNVLFLVSFAVISSFSIVNSLWANNQTADLQNPAFSIPVFNEPGGRSLGLITFSKKSRKSSRFDEFKISFFDKDTEPEVILFVSLISNELGLLYDEINNDFIKIVGYKDQIWVRKNDLDNLDVRCFSLDDFFLNEFKKGTVLYPGNESLPLRSGSGDGFRKIIDLYGNDYRMEYLGLRSGNWIKVTVLKCNHNNCVKQPDDLLFKIDGWVPVKNKNGEFLFHFFPNPCD